MSLENISLEARDELAALSQMLAENPETRKDFLRMTKKVKPDLPIPELDMEDYTRKAVGQSEARVQQLEQSCESVTLWKNSRSAQQSDEERTNSVRRRNRRSRKNHALIKNP